MELAACLIYSRSLVACLILGSSIWGKDKVLHEDVFAAKEEEEEEPEEIAKPGSVVFKKVCA